MICLDPGHRYKLDVYDGDSEDCSELVFMKRIGDGYPGNTGDAHPGTNLQDVLRVLIDRVKYLDNQIGDTRNQEIIAHLETSIWLLEQRAAHRHGFMNWECPTEKPSEAEYCRICGHITCHHEQPN